VVVSEHPHRERGRMCMRGRVSVAVVLMLAAALFVVSAREARDPATRRPQDLGQLTAAESDRVAELTKQVDDLRTQVDQLTAENNSQAGTSLGAVPAGFAVESGATPVSGPGLVVTLDDAPPDSAVAGVRPDVLVVHQQDLQAVMNALWAGGAEAMSLQDQRVVSTSAVRCVGNVLRLHGQVYSPPYQVRAIGDPAALRAALDASAAVRLYVRDAGRVGLGWQVDDAANLDLPAYAATELGHAQVPADVEVLPGLPVSSDGSSGSAATTGAAGADDDEADDEAGGR
jgi:uncharacterized protein YlxW (UPF0749 family)